MWENMMMHMSGHGWGHMLFGGGMMILFWGGLIALLVWLLRGANRGKEGSAAIAGRRPNAYELLQERYARGEIDRQEYEERKRDLFNG
jgi:putative membrane protein